MALIIPFAFTKIVLLNVKVDNKPWTCAKEVCKALEYGKATKTADIVKHLCSLKNYGHKCQFKEFIFVTK